MMNLYVLTLHNDEYAPDKLLLLRFLSSPLLFFIFLEMKTLLGT